MRTNTASKGTPHVGWGWRRKIVVFIAALLAAGLLWTGYVQYRIYAVQHVEAWRHADAAIVLGAAIWNDWPSPGLQERLEGGLRLYEEGLVDSIIVSGGKDANGAVITEAEGMKRYLLKRGVPETAIVLEDRARNTLENVTFSKTIMDNRGWETAILVTHHYHGARSLEIAKTVGLSDSQVYTVDSRVMNIPWHKARETLAYTKWTVQKIGLRVASSFQKDREVKSLER